MRTILNIKERPYGLLLVTAIVLLLAFVFRQFETVDHKTMFSVPLTVMVWIIPLFLISFWGLYMLTRRFLYSMTITRIHVFITVSATILIVTVLYVGVRPSRFAIGRPELVGNAMQLLVLLFLCGQFFYLANVLLGLFLRPKIHD